MELRVPADKKHWLDEEKEEEEEEEQRKDESLNFSLVTGIEFVVTYFLKLNPQHG